MNNFKSAFTMVELVFVIVVLGILAGVAVPRLAVTRDDATIAKIRADLASIRSGISMMRSERMLRGITTWPTQEELGTNFSNVVNGGVKGQWNGMQVCVRKDVCAQFAYNAADGSLSCTGDVCSDLGE